MFRRIRYCRKNYHRSSFFVGCMLFVFAAAELSALESQPEVANLKSKGLWFEANRGQVRDCESGARPDVLYTASVGAVRIFVRKTGLSYVFVQSVPINVAQAEASLGLEPGELSADILPTTRSESFRVDLNFEGASAELVEHGGLETGSVSNYYLGHCHDGLEDVRHYAEVVLRGLYENIDLRLYFADGKFKYDFVVRPGGDWRDISMRVVGADKVKLLEDGRLRTENPLGWMIEDAPVSWQPGSAKDELAAGAGQDSGPRRRVASRFVLEADRVTFELGAIDKEKDLIIDPSVVFGTYLGGGATDRIQDVAVDSKRRIYVVGDVNSINLPVTPGVFQRKNAGSLDVMLGRYSVKGVLEWLTYFGGRRLERGFSLAINASDEIGICGTTDSEDFPVTPGVAQSEKDGTVDAFVARFSSEGRRRWATFLGSERGDAANAIAANLDGNFVIVGQTSDNSTTFPLLNEWFDNKDGDNRGGFVALLNNATGTLGFSTYFTTDGANDQSRGVAVDDQNVIYVVGEADGQMPIEGSKVLQETFQGSADIILSRWTGSGRLLYCTHFGTEGFERAWDVAIQHQTGNVVVVGETSSLEYPLQNPLADILPREGRFVGCITMLDRALQEVIFSSYISTSSTASARAVAVSPVDGSIALSGEINDSLLLLTPDAEQRSTNANTGDRPDLFIWHMQADASALIYGSYFGAEGDDRALGLVFDQNGNYIIAGQTTSVDLPMRNAHQLTSNGSQDGFIRKYGCETFTEIRADGPLEFCEGGDVTLTAGDGFASYRWSSGEEQQFITVNAGGDYSVTVGDGAGCEFTTPATVVTVFPIPKPVITADGPLELCNGESVTLDAGPGFVSYKWSNDAETQTITVSESDTYFVIVEGEGGCEAEAEQEVTVRPTPVLTAQPAELDWGILDGCQSSVTLELELTNTMGFPVRLSDLVFSNDVEFGAANFSADMEIIPGGSRTLEIVFTPNTLDPVNATLSIQISPCDATLLVPLSGRKGELLLTATPANIDFGEVLLCERSARDSTFFLSNSGDEDILLESAQVPAPFSVVDQARLPIRIAPGETDSLRVRFAPAALVDAAIVLDLVYSSGSCNDVINLRLRGVARDPLVRLRDDAPLAFPRVLDCDEFSDANLLLELPAADALGELRIVAIDDASGQISGQDVLPIVLPAAELLRLPLRFTPSSEGILSGTATLTYELGGCSKTLSFEYRGEKRGISISLPDEIDFGAYNSCEQLSLTQRVQIETAGNDVFVNSVEIEGDFAASLLPGAPVPEFFDITFATDDPVATGRMVIVFRPCNIERVIELRGSRIDLNLSGPATADFGDVQIGTAEAQTFSWTNDGTGPLTIDEIDCLAAQFSLVAPVNLPVTLEVGESVEVIVQFDAAAVGPASGEVCLLSNSPCGLRFTTALSANGVDNVIPAAELEVYVEDLLANPHWPTFDIPLRVRTLQGFDGDFNVEALAYVRLNSSVFFPRSLLSGSIENNQTGLGERSLVLRSGTVTLSEDAPLVVINGAPLLGDAVTSDIVIDSVVFINRPVIARLENGSLTLDSLCEVGGPRLLTTRARFGIVKLTPNPSNRPPELQVRGVNGAPLQLLLRSATGHTVFRREWSSTTDEVMTVIPDVELAPGVYQAVLRSEFLSDEGLFVIVR